MSDSRKPTSEQDNRQHLHAAACLDRLPGADQLAVADIEGWDEEKYACPVEKPLSDQRASRGPRGTHQAGGVGSVAARGSARIRWRLALGLRRDPGWLRNDLIGVLVSQPPARSEHIPLRICFKRPTETVFSSANRHLKAADPPGSCSVERR